MEITKKQIQQVETYLDKKSFDFIDLKVEVLDHMVSDIESFLDNNYSFENAFKITVLKWDKHFKDTSSFYFGFQYSESKIVVKKAIKMFRPFYFIYLSAYILPVLFLKNVSIVFSKNTIYLLNGFLTLITAVFLIYLIFIIIKVIKSKVKTTYRFILRTQYLGMIFLVIPLLMGNHFNDKGNLNAVFTGFLFGGFAVTYICHYFFKKHQEAINIYKVS
jgi:hypothetical protein